MAKSRCAGLGEFRGGAAEAGRGFFAVREGGDDRGLGFGDALAAAGAEPCLTAQFTHAADATVNSGADMAV